MKNEWRFLEPLDRLFLRGNKLFGEPGSYGEGLIPPWPSVAAGALRSRMLVDDGVDLAAFAASSAPHPTLGTPATPGSFQLAAFQLAWRRNGVVEPIHPLPADLVVSRQGEENSLFINALRPTVIHSDITSSSSLPLLPLLPQTGGRTKPVMGYWLSDSGWRRWLAGDTPQGADLIHSGDLWQVEAQVGIGLESSTGAVAEGKLFSTQALTLGAEVGFIVGASGGQLPAGGLLRFGGDGRAVAIEVANPAPVELDLGALLASRRCRLVLTTPGIFAEGWLPTGVDGERRFNLHGVSGRLVAAAIPRADTISGWDLAQWQPKPAERVAAAGSVFWLDELMGDEAALSALLEYGLWGDDADAMRRAEGFNRIQLAAWR